MRPVRGAANAGRRTRDLHRPADSGGAPQAAARSEDRAMVGSLVRLLGQLVVLAMLALWMPPALADPAAPVEARTGNHHGFGRLVLEFGAHVAYQQAREGQHLMLRFGKDVTITPPAQLPHNVEAVTADPGVLDLTLRAGATTRVSWLANRLVVDVFDPANGASNEPPAGIPPTGTKLGRTAPSGATPTSVAPIGTAAAGPAPSGSAPTGTVPAGRPAFRRTRSRSPRRTRCPAARRRRSNSAGPAGRTRSSAPARSSPATGAA